MRYILQVHTGNFTESEISAKAVCERLSDLFKRIDISDVIFGWSADAERNRAISAVLRERGARGYFWLPIFSEARNPADSDAFLYDSGESGGAIPDLCRGESFDFICPASERNVRNALDTLESVAGEADFDGVFIDRIRYPSAANDPKALLGCRCPACRAAYSAAGIDISRLSEADLVPISISDFRYAFKSEEANRLFALKRQAVSRAVRTLADELHGKGYAVGLDSFAPALADFVGQDLIDIAETVDFVKPMLYSQTDAPAGMPFELRALQSACGAPCLDAINRLWGGDAKSEPISRKQLKQFQSSAGNVYPGIDCNRIDGICSATPESVAEGVRSAQDAGCEKAVIAWDAMRIGDDVIDALSRL